ncbi:hypothetical protein NicSoilB8_18500 [Arthrobacter sp. NicSoilB8]|nr:hypothetical protein NicSoilB8_18500 [Arthrobacter sp. NicSoilB8]
MYIDAAWVPLTSVRGWCQAAVVASSVVWVAGSGSGLVGPPPAEMWDHLLLLSGLFWWRWLVLYSFMPRSPILLVAGDKAGNWTKWYKTNIPVADDLLTII